MESYFVLFNKWCIAFLIACMKNLMAFTTILKYISEGFSSGVGAKINVSKGTKSGKWPSNFFKREKILIPPSFGEEEK